MTSRMATTAKIPIAPALLNKTKLDFQRKIKELQAWHDTFVITMSGQFLPMQLIYQGTTDRCMLKGVQFPDHWNVTYTANHWSNDSKAIQHLQIVLFPYVEKRKVEPKLPEDQKAMLTFDVFKGQITGKVTKFVEENNCGIVHVPNNMTNQFQPLDLNVNGHAKEFLKGKFEFWYAQQITNQLEGGSSVYDVSIETFGY